MGEIVRASSEAPEMTESVRVYHKDRDNQKIILSENRFSIRNVEVTKKPVRGGHSYVISNSSREQFLQTLHQLGYWKRLLGKGRYIYIKETNGVIEEVDKAIIRDDFFKYLEESGDINFSDNGNEVHFPVGAVKELYRRQQSQLFIDPILESLPSHDKPILRDTREICYKVFRNGIVVISKEDVAFMPFSDIKECIWKDSIIPHDIDISHPEDMLTGHFFHYLKNVAGNNIESFISAIGYLLHEYNSSAMGQAVICYDADAGEKGVPAGGTGKGIFGTAISKLINTAKIDGKKFRADSQFVWQTVRPDTRLVWIDDLSERIPFETFHSVLTDGFSIEQKNRDEYRIPIEESPKLLLTSNKLLPGEGSTNKRRQFIIEFSDHYSRKILTGTEEPIKDEHGCYFFSEDWDYAEWNKFFMTLIACIRDYLADGLIPAKSSNVKRNKLIQATSMEFAEYVATLKTGHEYLTRDAYEEFKGDDDRLTQRAFSNMIKTYAAIEGLEFKSYAKDKIRRFILTRRI